MPHGLLRHCDRALLPALAFFALTFAVTWTSWIAAVLMAGGRIAGGGLASAWVTLLVVAGIVAPAAAALALTARAEGRSGVVALLRRLVDWRVGARWYVVAVAYIVVVKLAAAAAYRLVEGAWPVLALGAAPVMLAATLFSTVAGGQAGEELGWRGYALPRLEALWGLGAASVVLGVVWAAWHLPLFWMPRADTYGQSFPLYLVQVTGLSVAVAWLYGHTGGSLLPVMLMHASFNNLAGVVPGVPRPATSPFVPDAPLLGWLTAAAIWVAAGWFLVRMPRARRPGSGQPLGLESGTARVVPYDDRWRPLFDEAAAELARVLGPRALAIHHVGSTAVPGLAAKPILDILVCIEDLDAGRDLVPRLEALGYEYRPADDIPDRHYFRRLRGTARTHHLSLAEPGSRYARVTLAFRDALRTSRELVGEYADLKLDLARRFPRDRPAYTDGKTAFVERVLGSVAGGGSP